MDLEWTYFRRDQRRPDDKWNKRLVLGYSASNFASKFCFIFAAGHQVIGAFVVRTGNADYVVFAIGNSGQTWHDLSFTLFGCDRFELQHGIRGIFMVDEGFSKSALRRSTTSSRFPVYVTIREFFTQPSKLEDPGVILSCLFRPQGWKSHLEQDN
jgi:hypothetical protein